jgi:hypothetical protein
MNLKKFFLPLLATMVIGCSSDDGTVPAVKEKSPVNFTVIGQTENSVIQFAYDAGTTSGITFNLTEELGVQTNYLTLRQSGNLLSFYSFANGSFSLQQKNLRTNETNNYDDFFANSPGRSVAWGINNQTNVFFGFFGPNSSRNLGIQDVALNSADVNDITIDFDIDFVFQPVLFENKIFFAYRDNRGNYKFTFYNTLSKGGGPILNFGNFPISFLVSDENTIVIIKNGVNPILTHYDPETLSELDEVPLNFGTALNQGPVDAVLEADRLYYSRPTVQPAKLFAEPAIFDVTTQEDFQIDLKTIITQLEVDFGADVAINSIVYSASKRIFLVGYSKLLQTEVAGGILQISPEGELIENIEVDFLPAFFVKG